MSDDLADVGDAALVVAIGRWRAEALAEAYRRHAGAVFALAVRVLGDRGRAEDVTQVVFSSLWEQADRYDPERGTLRSYLLTMAHRRAVDTLRADGRRKEREGRIGSLAEAPYDLEREVSDMAVGARVRAALGGLPTEQRQAIEMAYFAGHTYREVAVILGEAEGTVKSRIRYGLQHLRSALLDVGVDD